MYIELSCIKHVFPCKISHFWANMKEISHFSATFNQYMEKNVYLSGEKEKKDYTRDGKA